MADYGDRSDHSNCDEEYCYEYGEPRTNKNCPKYGGKGHDCNYA